MTGRIWSAGGVRAGHEVVAALPVAVLVFFVLGLAFWVGWTIATVRVEPEPAPDAPPEGGPGAEG